MELYIYLRSNAILFRSHEITFRSNAIILRSQAIAFGLNATTFRSNGITFSSRAILFRSHAVTFRSNAILFCFHAVIFGGRIYFSENEMDFLSTNNKCLQAGGRIFCVIYKWNIQSVQCPSAVIDKMSCLDNNIVYFLYHIS